MPPVEFGLEQRDVNTNNQFKPQKDENLRQFKNELVRVGPDKGFREGTDLHPAPMCFFFNAGGLGDYLNYAAAALWVAENNPWVIGTVYVSTFLVDFFRLLFKPFPRWKVEGGERAIVPQGTCFAGAELNLGNGMVINHQLLNATGTHLMTLAFAYYANKCPVPAGASLPHIRVGERHLRKELRGQKGKYVVFTPGAITPNRCTYGRHINPLISYVKSRGFLPVFLGKNEVTPDLNPVFPDDIAYSEGLDLRNRTTITEAAAILQDSRAVLGLDNGLLWLAALTDANIIFGYGIAGPETRRPYRSPLCEGKLLEVALTDADLACNHCQDKWKLLIGHSFHRCLYGDNKCVDLLFADEGARFKTHLAALGV